jgi:hypothetical protein
MVAQRLKPPAEPEAVTENQVSGSLKLVKLLTDSWQVIAAIVGICTVTLGAIAYFATRDQLTKTQCLLTYNILLNTLPSQVDQLTIKIKFDELDLAHLPKDSVARANIMNEIEEYKSQKKTLSDQYRDSLTKFQSGVCEIEKSKPENKQ